MRTIRKFRPTLLSLATAFAEQSEPTELVIPEDLSTLSDEALSELSTQAEAAFNEVYGDGTGLSDEQLTALASLTEGIEALATEATSRTEASAERDRQAAELAARVRPEAENLSADTDSDESDADSGDADEDEGGEDTDGGDAAESTDDENAAEPVVASARREVRVPLNSVRRAPQRTPQQAAPRGVAAILASASDSLGVANGEGVDWEAAGEMLNRRLGTFNRTQYESAAAGNRHVREQHSLLTLSREFDADHLITSNSPEDVQRVLDAATNEKNLPGGSLAKSAALTASGGWCAPSETMYDLVELGESRDGLLSVPEVGISRGGVQFTKGPDFATLYKDLEAGTFSFTEEQDIEGEYAHGAAPGDANVVGDKPHYKVECTEFEEHRLDVDGLWITAGLLQSKGYPELLARTLRGALIAHDHRLNAKMIAQMAASSDLIALAANQAGALAPTLSAIELQVEHYRYSHRMARTSTLEAVFPFWVRGAIRSDLSRRLGVDMIDVTDARIDGWFRSRGVNPQFVYNWQAIDSTAKASFTAWPTTVEFLLYSAGTWFRGASDLITIDTTYDSIQLAQNDFTALFTEEGWFVAKRGHDSRRVRVPLSADGATHIGVEIAHSGAAAA